MNMCKLLDWSTNADEVVAEGRWQTREPKALVNGLPLGLNAIKVFVDVVRVPYTFLWRPTSEHTNLEDYVKSFVAWPYSRVVIDGANTETPGRSSSPGQSPLATPAAPFKMSKPPSQSLPQTAPQISHVILFFFY